MTTKGDTNYFLATSPQDYRKCNDFLRKQGMHSKLSFPTIYAERHLHVIGLLGTIARKDMILAGPLIVAIDGNPAFVGMRLIQVYDDTMRKAGVRFYNFMATGHLQHLAQKFIDDMNLVEGETTSQGTMYRRVF